MIDLKFKPYLRDGVDVYINDKDKTVVFVFLSTRERIQLNVEAYLVKLLPHMDGLHTIYDLVNMAGECNKKQITKFISYLEKKSIIVNADWFENLELDGNYKARLEKQIFFLLDMTSSIEKTLRIQNKIKNTTVAIFGIGAIGSWLLVELLQMGFEKIKILDYDQVEGSDINRHAFFTTDNIGLNKAEAYKKTALEITPDAIINSHDIQLNTECDLDVYLNNVDLVINCADEPYIGYTSINLSRYVLKKEKLLFVAGGFDAHLASLGEMIIPFKTPCSDCYNNYFKKSLKGWKPIKHAVTDRDKGIGGLISLNVFSSSSAALSILQYFVDPDRFLSSPSGRGEFKFDDYSIDSFTVKRDVNCEVCGV